jgi:pimeloyl-ACP methyl ester carboxylesterase
MPRLNQRKTKRHVTNTLGSIGAIGLGVPLAWIGYSAALINRDVPLPPAINAERRTFTGATAGDLSYYADTRHDGKPLVLLHSINAGASAYEVRPLFEHYRAERPVYALDLPGFGFSERSDRPYTPDLYVAAIAEFLHNEVASQNGVDLLALSLSSEFAARVAHEQPELVSTLTLISPTGFSSEQQQNRIERAKRTGTSDRLYNTFTFPLWSQAFYDALVSRPSLRYFLQRQFAGPVDEGLIDYAYLATHQPGAKNAPYYFVSGKLFTGTIREEVYEQIEQPVLVVYDIDPNVTFDRLDDTLERSNWQGARIVPTRGLPHWEKLEETAGALDRFWQQHEVSMLER